MQMTPTVHEAGAVVTRSMDGAARLLLVRSSDGECWLFPKGHIEEGETAEQAALRETREEAGVDARVITALGRSQYIRRGKQIDVEYFLVEYLGELEPDEPREQRWCTCEEALELLSFDNLRPIAELACRTPHPCLDPSARQ
jgi:bis(5'-nucleosidyl)-tetraphosphatase